MHANFVGAENTQFLQALKLLIRPFALYQCYSKEYS